MTDSKESKGFLATSFFRLPSGTGEKLLAPITPAELFIIVRFPDLSGGKPLENETTAGRLDERKPAGAVAFVKLERHYGLVWGLRSDPKRIP
jgi:hypothetical protein